VAHPQQLQFVEAFAEAAPEYFRDAKTLEVGSLNINGSIRQFFSGGSYTGIDIAPGRDVDVVAQGQEYNAPSDHFDTVVSCEAMEHNPYWQATLRNMFRMSRPGGLVLMTCATLGRGEHGTTRTKPRDSPLTVGAGWNYYRNLSRAHVRRNLPLAEVFFDYRLWVNWASYDLYFAGMKRGEDTQYSPQWDEAIQRVDAIIEADNAPRRCRLRKLIAVCSGDLGFTLMRRVLGSDSYVLG